MAAEIEQAIKLTLFPRDTLIITDFGAVADDTSFLNTGAINSAIIRCHDSGNQARP
jgi:polygalacturonase